MCSSTEVETPMMWRLELLPYFEAIVFRPAYSDWEMEMAGEVISSAFSKDSIRSRSPAASGAHESRNPRLTKFALR